MAYQNFFAAKLLNDIGAGDTTITLDTAPTASSGRMVLEARNPTQREIIKYTGLVGAQLTGVIRGQGGTSPKPHTKNALVEQNLTAEDIKDLYDAFDTFVANNNDWKPLSVQPILDSGYVMGDGRYKLTIPNSDLTGILSPGMKLRVDRTDTSPTRSGNFIEANSQRAQRASGSVSGISFTDDFTVEAWVKVRSFNSDASTVLTRSNGVVAGWSFHLADSGNIVLSGYRIASNNRSVTGEVPVFPLNEWVHIAASIDMSGATGAMYMNGEKLLIMNSVDGTANALVQAGDLCIGGKSDGRYFDGEIADVRLWNAIRTETQIKDSMARNLAGNETNLIGYWKLDGDFNDSTVNANHLSPIGGAVATNPFNPYADRLYSVVDSVSYVAPHTVVEVVAKGVPPIPNEALVGSLFSEAEAPYGTPKRLLMAEGSVISQSIRTNTTTSGTSDTEVAWNGRSYLPFKGEKGRLYKLKIMEPNISGYGGSGVVRLFVRTSLSPTFGTGLKRFGYVTGFAIASGGSISSELYFRAEYDGWQYLNIGFASVSLTGTMSINRSVITPGQYTILKV